MYQLKEFIEKFSEDKEFRNAIVNAPDVKAKRRIIREAGFELDEEEIKRYLEVASNELPDEILDNVIGGTQAQATLYLTEQLKKLLESFLWEI